MKLIIDIPKEHYRTLQEAMKNHMKSLIGKIILNGTPIPDNATNGDVLSSIFNIDIKNKLVHDDITAYEITVDLGTNWTTLRINKDWWNSPYQKGGK